MREFFKSRRFKIILAVVAVLLGGMLYSATTGGLATLPEKVLSYVVIPVQKAAAWVSDGLTDFFTVFFDARENYEENLRLKEKISDLRKQLVDYEATKTENERLKEITGLKELQEDIEFQPAGVIAREHIESLHAEIVSLCPARVHTQQHFRPVLSLGAAGTGMQ